ncbi:MAG TPA: hypothetical protein VFW15_02855, partial [Thermoanaerobaculia bacterium]|nr:hypothetical protein [Thermoanaerobaculia bacterium]
VSPNGKRLAFSVDHPEGKTLLWYRDLDAATAVPIPGTDEATFPFWSPDSRSIGFFARGRLKVVEASGSAPAPRALADVGVARGGSWSADGTILFCPSLRHHLMRVPAAGGNAVAVTRLEEGEIDHSWPWFLPDGRRFLFRIRYFQTDRNALFLASLDSKERRLVLQIDSDVAYSSGHLVFRRGDRLMAAPFDPAKGRIEGEPVELAQGVEYNPSSAKTVFSVSENLLAYAGRSGLRLSRLVWFDRTGRELGDVGPPAIYISPTLSRDGRKVAVSLAEDVAMPPDVWIYDAALRSGTRLTRGRLAELIPVFSPDGRRIVFASNQKGRWDLHEISIAAAGGEERVLLESEDSKWPTSLSPDGSFLLFREFDRETLGDLRVLPLSGEPRPRDFVATRYNEEQGVFSPDGRWVAYTSDESGRMEIYVASFSEPGRRYRVSSGGGAYPRWSHDGRELFYLVAGKTMTAVSVRPEGAELTFGSPQPLFKVPVQMLVDTLFGPSKYDVGADGRFLIAVRASDEPQPPLALVLNWAEALKPRP